VRPRAEPSGERNHDNILLRNDIGALRAHGTRDALVEGVVSHRHGPHLQGDPMADKKIKDLSKPVSTKSAGDVKGGMKKQAPKKRR